MTPCHRAAREYLALGLHPIPCAPRSKRALVKWERYQREAPMLDEIDAWWEETPDANVALVLGRGTFAVDLDGEEATAMLRGRGITLPVDAPRSRTAHGHHVLLATAAPVGDAVGLLRGIPRPGREKPAQVDIRGVGIIVAPPSIHPTGARYEWEVPLHLPLPDSPPELVALIQRHAIGADRAPTETVGSSWVIEALRGVGEGLRDDTCAKLAGYLLGKGLDSATVEAVLCESFARQCMPPFPPADVRKTVQSIARKDRLTNESKAIVPVPLSTVLDALTHTLEAGPAPAVSTPFMGLNRFLGGAQGGFRPGELVYLGARPGVGKTAFGLEMARTVAKAGRSVLVISREMLNAALACRLIAQEGRIPASSLKGRLGEGDWVRVRETMRQLRGLPIWLTDEAVSLTEMTDCVSTWTPTPPLGLVIVDYLQLVRAPAAIRERRHQIEAVSQGLKTLAMQGRLPVLCLSSLSRPVDHKETRPTLASLRESGELEHDADVVLMLHRGFQQIDTECWVYKNRDGRTGCAKLRFLPDYVAFEDVEEEG